MQHTPAGNRRRLFFIGMAAGGVAIIALQALSIVIAANQPAARSAFAEALGLRYHWPKTVENGLRAQVLNERSRLLSNDQLVEAAGINAMLSQEALNRARATMAAWLTRQHPTTKLFPQSPNKPVWNYKNVAADNFCHMFTAAGLLMPQDVPKLATTLRAESSLFPKGTLCGPVSYNSGEILSASAEDRLFGSSEYVKDGLLSIFERFAGDTPLDQVPIGQRLLDVLDTVIAQSTHQSQFGPIPGAGSEVNGNVLQSCSRLAGSHPGYADMAARIADAAVHQMLAIHGVPLLEFDYETNEPVKPRVELRDHGNEIIPGLSEAYALAVSLRSQAAWQTRADAWAEPLAHMYEKLLLHGRSPAGVLIGAFDPETNEQLDTRINDNWGYILNGVLLYVQAARQHGTNSEQRLVRMELAIDQTLLAVTTFRGSEWEGSEMDGYADTLESAMYLAHYRPTHTDVLTAWVDEQIDLLFARQKDTGIVDDTYLDGNFIRTALLYAQQKSGGFRVVPWRSDVRVGLARQGGRAAVVVSTTQPYIGRLESDRPRHRLALKLPWDWPRLNSWPEWYIPDSDDTTNPPLERQPNGSWVLPLNLPAGGTMAVEMVVTGPMTR